jgi:hypothetical protein
LGSLLFETVVVNCSRLKAGVKHLDVFRIEISMVRIGEFATDPSQPRTKGSLLERREERRQGKLRRRIELSILELEK